jgi:cytochrome c-type biogenesis protein CcmH/NrfG
MNLAPVVPRSNLSEPENQPLVAGGALNVSLEPTMSGDRLIPTVYTKSRFIGGVLGSAVLVLAVFVPTWLWWHVTDAKLRRGHWDTVARGREALRRRRPDLALREVQAVRDEAPGAGEAMTIAGMALLRLREYRGARLALERALKLQPNQFDAAITLAELNFGLGNGARGIEVLQMAARLQPQEFRVWLTMGKVLFDLGDPNRAIQAYEKALGLNPEDHDALVGLIRCLIGTDVSDQAEPWVAKALAKYPDDPTVLGFAARVAFDDNRLDDAIALADRTLARDFKNLDALLARARARVVQAQWQQALPDAECARVAHPNDLGTLQLLHKIQTKLGLTERAAITQAQRVRAQDRLEVINRLKKEINLHPEDPKLVWTMGKTAWEGGSFLLASRCFEAALALDPNFQQARESLAALRTAEPDLTRSPDRATLFLPEVGISSPSSVTSP